MERSKSASYRDSAGKTLADYPRPSVAVDAALLTVMPDESCLSVLQVQRTEGADGVPAAGWKVSGSLGHGGIDSLRRCSPVSLCVIPWSAD